MIRMSKIVVVAVAVLLGRSTLAQSPSSSLEGIWLDTRNHGQYFSIQVEGSRLVMIDLTQVEVTRSTLKATYMGEITLSASGHPTAKVVVLEDSNSFRKSAGVSLISETEASIAWCSQLDGACVIGLGTTLRKVF